MKKAKTLEFLPKMFPKHCRRQTISKPNNFDYARIRRRKIVTMFAKKEEEIGK